MNLPPTPPNINNKIKQNKTKHPLKQQQQQQQQKDPWGIIRQKMLIWTYNDPHFLTSRYNITQIELTWR